MKVLFVGIIVCLSSTAGAQEWQHARHQDELTDEATTTTWVRTRSGPNFIILGSESTNNSVYDELQIQCVEKLGLEPILRVRVLTDRGRAWYPSSPIRYRFDQSPMIQSSWRIAMSLDSHTTPGVKDAPKWRHGLLAPNPKDFVDEALTSASVLMELNSDTRVRFPLDRASISRVAKVCGVGDSKGSPSPS